jgi:hypothetical protein|tara:strand:+ start:216 stop:356 length:141 start_codon:yes stop_codon:yes gene_type:complete
MVVQGAAIPLMSLKMIGVFKTNIKVGKVDADKTRDKPAHRIEKNTF